MSENRNAACRIGGASRAKYCISWRYARDARVKASIMFSAIEHQVRTMIEVALTDRRLCKTMSPTTLMRKPQASTITDNRGGGPKNEEKRVWIRSRAARTNRLKTIKTDSWRLKDVKSG